MAADEQPGLVEFLRQRLDEDEEVARGADPGPWRAEGYVYGKPEDGWGDPTEWEVYGPDGAVVAHQPYEGGGCSSEPSARHIARHDPARVLADVDAKRRIIELCAPPLVDVTGPTDRDRQFLPGEGRPWGEPVLRLLALPYASHPDYRDEEWKP